MLIKELELRLLKAQLKIIGANQLTGAHSARRVGGLFFQHIRDKKTAV